MTLSKAAAAVAGARRWRTLGGAAIASDDDSGFLTLPQAGAASFAGHRIVCRRAAVSHCCRRPSRCRLALLPLAVTLPSRVVAVGRRAVPSRLHRWSLLLRVATSSTWRACRRVARIWRFNLKIILMIPATASTKLRLSWSVRRTFDIGRLSS